NGSGNATGVYVTDLLNTSVLSFVGSNGSYDDNTGVWSIGSLGAGESVALSITVVIIGNGTVINTASVTVDQNNTNTNNGSDNEIINVTNYVNVSVVKVSNTTGTANIGDVITYTIIVSNNGSGNATGVYVTDLLNTSVLSFVGSNGSYDNNAGVWSIGSLGVGETVALSITVVIIGNGTVINTASVSVDQNNTNVDNGSDNETINVSNNVNVSVVKVSNTTGSANIGDVITYTIIVSNNGFGNATGVFVTDVLNASVLSFVGSNGSYDDNTGVWSIGDLGAGETVVLSITVVIIGNGTVINTASVTVDQNNTNVDNGSDNETINVTNNVNVSVVKVSNTTGSANIGDIITYTITVTNNGSGNATGVYVTDLLNTSVLSFVGSNGSYDDNTGVWSIGDLGAGESVALSITVVIIGNGTVTNIASVTVDQNNTNVDNGSDNETINVNNNVNVSVVKVSNTTGTANIGDIITYTITVSNNGSGNATGVYVTDLLNTTVLSFVSSNGSYDNNTGIWTIGSLGAGETVALSITVVIIGNGTVINTAGVSVDQNNTNVDNGSDNETIIVSNNVNVSVVKVSNTTGAANIGDVITYTITVSNNGFGNATGVYVTDLLNASVLSFVGSNGSYDNVTGVWSIGDLGAGEAVALSITVVIIGNGTVINTASVTVDQNNTNVDNGSDNETINVSNNVNVSVVKVSNTTGSANIGDIITYTITVSNNGSGNATGVYVTDLLNASVLSFVGSNGSYDNNTGVWSIGSLGAGESVALSITVVIIGNGTVTNTASVTVDQNNTNTNNGSDNETINVSNNVNVSVVKVSNTTGTANIGDIITYTITVTNNGSGNATGVYVNDLLNTTVLSFVGSNGSYDDVTGVWSIGDLGAGESVALSITVVIIGNGTVINTASVSVDQNNTNVDNGSDNETINVSNNVNVSVVKVSNTTGSANIGDIITYTITVSNNGSGNATGVYVTDLLNTTVLSFVSSNGSYDNNTGVWTIGDLGAGETVALNITVVIIGNGTVINTASVSVDQNNTNVDNGSDNETIIVSNNVNVSVVKVSNTTGAANIGDVITYTIIVSNNGSGNATGVYVTDLLNTTVLSFVSSNGYYDNNTGIWTIGSLGAGETIALSITVVIIGNGTVINTASVTVDQNNTNTNNGSDNETINVTNNVNVSVVKVSNTTGSANIGDTVTYTIIVSNNGSGNATGVFVTDVLNASVLSFVGSNGSYDNNTGVWSIGSLGAGETVALSITVVIIGNGTVINTASVIVDQNNTNVDNGSDNETINVSNNVNVGVVKVSNTTGTANIGDIITYTITVSNNGSGNATGVYVTDVLNTSVLSFVGSNGSYDNNTGVWSIGSLGAGETVALSITVVIIGNGTVINTASVTVDQNNTNTNNGSDNETINVSNNVNVGVVKVSNTTGSAN
ncbi:beta strand repeat-containing protein, partial [Methanobrevibacter filiformis]|uniref:beta strand repeat-containing protein n=1 Tax=Methanobrevibacter filiformis TaxID=55758 RepID=UPI000A47DC64